MFCDLVSRKNEKNILYKKTLCLGKTVITFAYEVG
jgi:hypothetical protein